MILDQEPYPVIRDRSPESLQALQLRDAVELHKRLVASGVKLPLLV